MFGWVPSRALTSLWSWRTTELVESVVPAGRLGIIRLAARSALVLGGRRSWSLNAGRVRLSWRGSRPVDRRINVRPRSASLARWRSGTAIDPGVCRDSLGVFQMTKKSMLLLGAVMALCAFVLPSVASAASWSPVGTTDGRLDSANLGFSSAALNSGSSCGAVSFSVTVHSAAVATITGASFASCFGDLGAAAGCTATAVGTNFPWRATAVATNNIQIHGVDIDVQFETIPGTNPTHCARNGVSLRLTGTVSGGVFTPGAAGSTRRIDLGGATGLVAHVPGVGGGIPAVPRGSVTATGLLNVLD